MKEAGIWNQAFSPERFSFDGQANEGRVEGHSEDHVKVKAAFAAYFFCFEIFGLASSSIDIESRRWIHPRG
jgi:hypothetical protein